MEVSLTQSIFCHIFFESLFLSNVILSSAVCGLGDSCIKFNLYTSAKLHRSHHLERLIFYTLVHYTPSSHPRPCLSLLDVEKAGGHADDGYRFVDCCSMKYLLDRFTLNLFAVCRLVPE